jgi:hypothetical protein
VPLLFPVVLLGQSPDGPPLQDLVFYAGAEKLAQMATAPTGAIIDRERDGSLPQDIVEPFEGRPSLRVMVSGQGKGSWQAIFAPSGWATFDLRRYYDQGSLVMQIKGSPGGAKLRLALQDRDAIRRTGTSFSSDVSLKGGEWEKIVLPLKSIVRDPAPFRMDQARWIRLHGTGEATFWIGDLRIVSPGVEPAPEPRLKVRLAGFDPAEPKRVVASAWGALPRSFEVVDSGGRIAARGSLRPDPDIDPESGERTARGDFSSLRAPGEYRIRAAGFGESRKFFIRGGLAQARLTDVLKTFYLQRSGLPILQVHVAAFSRPAGHPSDNALSMASGLEGKRDASGGWYRGSDYVKSVQGEAASWLMWAYELSPRLFPDGRGAVPEGLNGVPDILDEARWHLEWMLKMQDASGQLSSSVEPGESAFLPGEDQTERQVRDDDDPAATLEAAGTLAHAAVIWSRLDPAFSLRCQEASLRGWEAAKGGANALRAAAPLFRLTGRQDFHDAIRASREWSEEDLLSWAHYGQARGTDSLLLGRIRGGFFRWAGSLSRMSSTSPWGALLAGGEVPGGSNGLILRRAAGARLGAKVFGVGDDEALALRGKSLDYLLGMNPLGRSYVSGWGEGSIRWASSQIYANDALDPMPPGYVVSGPAASEGRFVSAFPLKRHQDSLTDPATNRVSLDWNGMLVFLLGN